jgi:tetratricopeptide (TPR) repeat protein
MRFLFPFVLALFINFPLFAQDISKEELKKEVDLIEGDLMKARIHVDKLCSDPSTSNRASSWYLKGYVYTEISKSEVFSSQVSEPAKTALEAIKKAKELDKNKLFYSEILNVFFDLTPLLYNKAILAYNKAVQIKNEDEVKKYFTDAAYYFSLFFDALKNLGTDKSFIISKYKIDTDKTYYYYAYSLYRLGEYDKAEQYFEKIVNPSNPTGVEKQKSSPLAYNYYSELLEKKGDIKGAIDIMIRANEIWPNNKDILINTIALLNKYKKTDELIKFMSKLGNNISDPLLLSVMAQSYRGIARTMFENGYVNSANEYTDKAAEYYKKALEKVKSDNNRYKILYNIGVTYFNQGVKLYKNNYEDREAFQAAFKKSIDYLEQARKLQPNNKRLLNMLMKAYQMTDQTEKAEEISKKLY